MKQIKGKFDVQTSPLDADDLTRALGAMQMKIDKQFHGALAASSVVLMMGVMDREIGSGGYVALEKVTGQLEGKQGSFLLQHSSTMERGRPSQNIHVVPDSGTGALMGLKGQMVVDIVEGQHFYTFDYVLAVG